MKAFFIIIGRSIQKRKAFSIVIIILAMVAALFLISALGLIAKSHAAYESSYQASGESELIYGFPASSASSYMEEYERYFKGQAEVSDVIRRESLLGLLDVAEENIQTLFCAYEPERFSYAIYEPAGFTGKLSGSEVLVPMDFYNSYGYRTGDGLRYQNMEFTIAGFYEDPICGSPFYHTKRILVSETMFAQLRSNATESGREDARHTNELREITFLNISLKPEYCTDLKNTTAKLERSFDGKDASIYAFSQYRLTTVRTMVPRIILAVLALFALFLFGIMSLVIRYAIMAAIEEDYRSLGIMKAIGFEGSHLVWLLLMQYLFLCFAGLLAGLAGAYLVTPPIGGYLLAVSGIVWSGSIDFAAAILVSGVFLILTALIVYLQARKAAKIKPARAILFGNRKDAGKEIPVRLASHFLSFRMGMKQLSGNAGQYVTLFLLVILFSFMVTNIAGLSNAFANEERVAGILGYDMNDIKITVTDADAASEDAIADLAEWIDSRYSVTCRSIYETDYDGYVEDMSIQLLGYSEFQTSNIIEGTCPEKPDEVMISSGISEELQKNVGDTVEIAISRGGTPIPYRITGINNQVYDLGKNITLSKEGLELLMPDYVPDTYLLKIAQHENMQEVIDTINREYPDMDGVVISNERAVMQKRVNAIQTTLHAITIGVMAVSLFLVALVTFLVSIVMIYREITENGIMKSIGFSSGQLRIQFTSRFLIVAMAGGMIGAIISLAFDGRLINLLFSLVNIAKIPSGISMASLFSNFVFLVLAAALSAWWVSGRLKRLDVRVLLAD